MKFHLTKTIQNHPPVHVVKALEKCLKQEAWEIKRYDKQVVALGIGTSRSTVNLSDNATFDIDFSEGATTVQVEVEYQYTWFLSEDSQNDTVHSRFESIFANLHAELDHAPEWLVPQREAKEQPVFSSELTTSSETSMPAIASVSPSKLDEDEEVREPTQQAPVSEVERPPAVSSITPELQKAPKHVLEPSDARKRLGFGVASLAVSLIVASIIVVVCVVFGISHPKNHPLRSNAPKPSPSIQTAIRNPSPPPDIHPKPFVSPSPKKASLSDSVARSQAPSEDLRRWLGQWAASERTRDARSQASFYGDDVRPYRTHAQANRDAIYQDKLDSIHNRKGLWTFKIEDVSIRREGPDEASVLLKKLVMTQTDSVLVSEHRISSFLTLQRTQDGWQITGERDLK